MINDTARPVLPIQRDRWLPGGCIERDEHVATEFAGQTGKDLLTDAIEHDGYAGLPLKQPAPPLPHKEGYGFAPDEPEQCIAVTIFYGRDARRKSMVELSLEELADRIRGTTASSKDKLPWLKLARFGDARTSKGSLRHNDNVLAITGIEMDYDGQTEGEAVSVDAAMQLLERNAIESVVYTTPSNTEIRPRWRVLCPLSQEQAPDKRERFVGQLQGLFGGIFAPESFTLSQAYYFGSVNGNTSHRVAIVHGTRIDKHRGLDAIWMGPPTTKTLSCGKTGQPIGLLGSSGEEKLLRAIGSGADFHQPCIRLSGRWASNGVPMIEARERLDDAFTDVPEEKRDARWAARYADLDRCVRDIYVKEASRKDHAQIAGNSLDAREGPLAPRDLPLIWMKDMRPRISGGGTLIKGLLDAGAMSVIYAPSNVGKSFFALDIAFHIASGRAWCGHKVKKQGFVLYLAAEGGLGFINRVEAIKRHYRIPCDADIPLAVVPAGFDLLEAGSGDHDRIVRLVKDAVAACGHELVMIVIDTLSRAMAGGDENSAQDMTAVVKNIDLIREHVNAHIMLVHHAGKDVGRGARGHSSLRAATDTEIEIVRGGEAGDKCAIAHVRKQRDMSGDKSYPFTLKQIVLGVDEDGDQVTSAVIEMLDHLESKQQPKRPRGQAACALNILRGLVRTSGTGPVREDSWRTAFYEATPGTTQGAKQRAFRRAFGKLVENKSVGKDKGRVWIIEEPESVAQT